VPSPPQSRTTSMWAPLGARVDAMRLTDDCLRLCLMMRGDKNIVCLRGVAYSSLSRPSRWRKSVWQCGRHAFAVQGQSHFRPPGDPNVQLSFSVMSLSRRCGRAPSVLSSGVAETVMAASPPRMTLGAGWRRSAQPPVPCDKTAVVRVSAAKCRAQHAGRGALPPAQGGADSAENVGWGIATPAAEGY